MKTKGQILEGIAFNWCKVATILLLLWLLHLERWALPIAAAATAGLFIAAYGLGARESRCILKRPLLIAAFWSCICAAWWLLHR